MGKDYASKMCGFKCRLEDLIEEYAEMRPSERVAAAMLPLIACWKELDAIGARMRSESELSDDELTAWLDGMDNADGTHGAHWTQAQTTAVGDSIGIDWGKVSPKCWHVAMNMMYSDYFGTAAKFKQTGPEFFAELAKDFLMDPDGGSPREKLAGYYHGIVKNARKD